MNLTWKIYCFNFYRLVYFDVTNLAKPFNFIEYVLKFPLKWWFISILNQILLPFILNKIFKRLLIRLNEIFVVALVWWDTNFTGSYCWIIQIFSTNKIKHSLLNIQKIYDGKLDRFSHWCECFDSNNNRM